MQKNRDLITVEKNKMVNTTSSSLPGEVIDSIINPEIQCRSPKYNQESFRNLRTQLNGIKTKMSSIMTSPKSKTKNEFVFTPNQNQNIQRSQQPHQKQCSTCKTFDKQIKELKQEKKSFMKIIQTLQCENKRLRNNRFQIPSSQIVEMKDQDKLKRQTDLQRLSSVSCKLAKFSECKPAVKLIGQFDSKAGGLKLQQNKQSRQCKQCKQSGFLIVKLSKHVKQLEKRQSALSNNVNYLECINKNYCGLLKDYNSQILELKTKQSNAKYQRLLPAFI